VSWLAMSSGGSGFEQFHRQARPTCSPERARPRAQRGWTVGSVAKGSALAMPGRRWGRDGHGPERAVIGDRRSVGVTPVRRRLGHPDIAREVSNGARSNSAGSA